MANAHQGNSEREDFTGGDAMHDQHEWSGLNTFTRTLGPRLQHRANPGAIERMAMLPMAA
jgi:hypothetical protein